MVLAESWFDLFQPKKRKGESSQEDTLSPKKKTWNTAALAECKVPQSECLCRMTAASISVAVKGTECTLDGSSYHIRRSQSHAWNDDFVVFKIII